MHRPESSHPLSTSLPYPRLTQALLLAVVLIFTATPICAEDQQQSSIRSSIFALDSARKTALQELEGQAISGSEASDYRDFIIFLNTRIINYCTELAAAQGTKALESLPCPTGAVMTGNNPTQPPSSNEIFYTTATEAAPAQTRAEKTMQLEGSLLSALGEFDEMLLKEEDKVAARVPSQREAGDASLTKAGGGMAPAGEAGSGQASRSGEQGTGDEHASAAGGLSEDRAGSVSASQRTTGPGAASGDSSSDHSAYGAPGGKLPPPEDDDIVARQLREAAEKEPDPALKKKLWEEYWKYKGVSSKGT